MAPAPQRDEWMEWMALAQRAPSGGNVQPWRFVANARGELRCYIDTVRAENFLDFELGASHLALGAAVESLLLAAAVAGYRGEVEPGDSGDGLHVCTVRLRAAAHGPDPVEARLAAELTRRATNRRMGSGAPLPGEQLAEVQASAEPVGGRLRFANDPAAKRAMAEVVGGCDRIRMCSEHMHRELMAEVRWTPEQAERTGDGVDLRTLEANAVQRMLLRRLSHFSFVDRLRRLGLGGALEGVGAQSVKAASAVALLTVEGLNGEAYFRGGRALQRVWLTTSALGIGFQPLAVPPYMFARLLRGDGFTDAERDALGALRARFEDAFPGLAEDHAEVMLFRLTDADPPSTPSYRRPVEASFEYE